MLQNTLFGLSFLILLVPGCGSSGPIKRSLHGTVTFSGQPVSEGTIRFESMEGTPHCIEGASIQNGEYQMPSKEGVLPGKYRVIISAPKPGVASGTAGGVPFSVPELLPEKYNVKSELTIDVTADGKTDFSFELKP